MNRLCAGAAAVALMSVAGAALGQNALGDGRGLERDLRVGGPGGGLAPRANFMNEVRARNAAITGNAPNGQSLQINSPYSAPDDFRGNLATDSIYRFQRDSLGSSYIGAPRGRQWQNLFSRGLWSPASRLDTYGAATDLPKTSNTPRTPISETVRQRAGTPDLGPENALVPTSNGKESGPLVTAPVGTLRSTGAYASTTELNPALVGYQQSETGSMSRVTASGLLGVRMAPKYVRPTERQAAEKPPEKTAMEAMGLDASPTSSRQPAPISSFKTSYEDLRDRLGATMQEEPAKGPTPGQPEKILPAGQQPENAPAAKKPGPVEPGTRLSWQDRVDTLRLRLEKGKRVKDKLPDVATKDQEKVKDVSRIKPPEAGAVDTGEGDTPERNKKNKYAMAGLDQETLDLIRKAGGEAKSYTAGAPGSLFEVHLKAGEEELAKGRYFDAEERFARALAMRPGDATVQAARLNAQIGAGLYVSAATNLRQLFQQHPEVIGVRYTGTTMPALDRQKAMIAEMRESISKAKKEGRQPTDEAGLLLAYVGHQTKDDAATREGIAAMRETKDGATDPLVAVLEGVWLGTESK